MGKFPFEAASQIFHINELELAELGECLQQHSILSKLAHLQLPELLLFVVVVFGSRRLCADCYGVIWSYTESFSYKHGNKREINSDFFFNSHNFWPMD